uniref:DNA damage-binding protein 1 n=1 Tax=Phytophthora ramorum TaxID=164328 RepID=H3G8E6_PHYRM
MAYSYVATAQKPTSVTHSLTAAFTGPNDTNLLLAKSTRFEVHLLTPEGLQPQHDINLYGRIAIFEVFRAANEPQDWLFIVTQRFQFCVLAYDAATQQVVTKAHGTIRDSIGRSSEIVTSGNIDPEGRLIGMNLYEGYFKVIPIDSGKGILKDTFNIRLDELRVIDIKFLHGYNKPTICVLYEDYKAARHLKTYHILLKEKDFAEGPWSQSNVESGASLLIPVPAPTGGVLIVSNQTIVYHNGSTFHAIPMQSTVIQVYGAVDKDGSRFLLADQYGTLSVVALQHTGKEVTGVHLEVLGDTSIASCLSYLDNGVVFIGSTFGDSQLIKLNADRDEHGSYVEVLDTYVNVGPIIDFCVMDLDRQGQGQIVTCSGADKDGTLRVIRNGIGINEQASAELPGIKGMWALRETFAAEHDKYLLQSYVSEIRILAIGDEDEMEEKEIPAFTNAKTLLCRNMYGDAWLQVTESEVRLISCSTFSVGSTWSPPSGSRITVAAANPTQVVVATSGGVLVYLEVENGQITEKTKATMEHEIACVDITPLARNTASFCVVGLWTNFSVSVVKLPTLEKITTESLGNDLLPRSVLCNTFEGKDYLLVGLGDGSLMNYELNAEKGTLGTRKRVSLGSQPLSLSTFRSKNMTHVFAACDRPTVIYSNNNKLLYSNINSKEVNVMCPFDSESFPECLALSSEEELTIGTVDDIQKLHIQTFHLNEWARRVAHDPDSHTLGVLTVNFTVDDTGEEVDQGFVRLFDDQTFEVLHSYRLDPFETPCSVAVCPFSGDSSSTSYFVVGTAYVHEEEAEPHQGRILVFAVTGIHGERKLQLVTEKEVKGAVYCLNSFNGKILAGVNSKAQLYKWSESADNEKELVSECGHYGHTLVLYMESRGDFIVVGDLMKSISLLSYKQLDGTIEEIAKDLNSNWMSAVGIVDDDTYIGSETDFNLFTVQRNSGAASDEERGRLETVGEFHLGEFNNTAITQNPAAIITAVQNQSMLFGTVSGMIGVILPISKDQYSFLVRVQQALTQVVKGVGGFSHKDWRTFENRRSVSEARNFIDGDLVESFLDLPKPQMAKSLPNCTEP